MPANLRRTILAAAGAAVFAGSYAVRHSTTMLVLCAACAVMAVIFLLMTGIGFLWKKTGRKPLSGWKLFAVCDVLIMIAALLIGLLVDNPYSAGTAMGDGWLGAILIWYGLPLLGGILIIELLIYRVYKSKTQELKSEEPEQKLPPRIPYPADTARKDGK